MMSVPHSRLLQEYGVDASVWAYEDPFWVILSLSNASLTSFEVVPAKDKDKGMGEVPTARRSKMEVTLERRTPILAHGNVGSAILYGPGDEEFYCEDCAAPVPTESLGYQFDPYNDTRCVVCKAVINMALGVPVEDVGGTSEVAQLRTRVTHLQERAKHLEMEKAHLQMQQSRMERTLRAPQWFNRGVAET